MQPRHRFLIDDVDAAVETIVGGNDQHVHARFDFGAVVDHIGHGNRRLFGNQRHGTHEYLRRLRGFELGVSSLELGINPDRGTRNNFMMLSAPLALAPQPVADILYKALSILRPSSSPVLW